MQTRGQTALFGRSMVCNCGFHAVKTATQLPQAPQSVASDLSTGAAAQPSFLQPPLSVSMFTKSRFGGSQSASVKPNIVARKTPSPASPPSSVRTPSPAPPLSSVRTPSPAPPLSSVRTPSPAPPLSSVRTSSPAVSASLEVVTPTYSPLLMCAFHLRSPTQARLSSTNCPAAPWARHG
ncbi:leucine-rich repeat extensin-like protein 5 isoform X1 [Hypomesus transpacificus]|uniref:leucine-rich repeat extensin-like protein 5 isoform X1 n=1 Tax=Hypomesus transpacificus TaxID=137520 RepID=UPI001F07F21A|nr:leucine-rich repeat extensin-like protein 5 isoform X1 [Hypomesus transpacificus]XP_046875429.1 leucine-rich repeat extensin-like protein 5 isoform X1 [Hypomesus transpacificus]